MQKVRGHAVKKHSAPTACKLMVSGSISLPFRGSFHLSLTVLLHYRSPKIFSLRGWSPQIPNEFHVLGGTRDLYLKIKLFRGQDYHLLWRVFPDPSTKILFCNFMKPFRRFPIKPHNPRCTRTGIFNIQQV